MVVERYIVAVAAVNKEHEGKWRTALNSFIAQDDVYKITLRPGGLAALHPGLTNKISLTIRLVNESSRLPVHATALHWSVPAGSA